MTNLKPPFNSTRKHDGFSDEAKRLITEMGLDPDALKRENAPEVMMPKMAVTGIIDSIQQLCEAQKINVDVSITGLNVNEMTLFSQSVQAALDMIHFALDAYQQAKESQKALEQQEQATKRAPANKNETHYINKEEEEEEEEDSQDQDLDHDAFGTQKTRTPTRKN